MILSDASLRKIEVDAQDEIATSSRVLYAALRQVVGDLLALRAAARDLYRRGAGMHVCLNPTASTERGDAGWWDEPEAVAVRALLPEYAPPGVVP